jgi:hypothetical protein
LTAIVRAAELLTSWSEQVDDTHAQPGTVEAMRSLASEVRAEYRRLASSPGAALDALIKAWSLRELDAMPHGLRAEWLRTGAIPPELQHRFAGLPEPVASLIGEHVADSLGICECCGRRAPCRLLSDGTESGERDWRCAWSCPATSPDVDPVLEWARAAGL